MPAMLGLAADVPLNTGFKLVVVTLMPGETPPVKPEGFPIMGRRKFPKFPPSVIVQAPGPAESTLTFWNPNTWNRALRTRMVSRALRKGFGFQEMVGEVLPP